MNFTDGLFRETCENVLSVLRANRDSVLVMLEAFLHDPLVDWLQKVNAPKPGQHRLSSLTPC